MRTFALLLSWWCVGLGGLGARLGDVELARLLARDQPDLDEVERADEAIADAVPAGARDRVAQRHGPVVLDQDQRRGGVVRDLFDHVPRLLVGEDSDAVGARLGARFRAGL